MSWRGFAICLDGFEWLTRTAKHHEFDHRPVLGHIAGGVDPLLVERADPAGTQPLLDGSKRDDSDN
ncbi:hypothetical protein [Halorhabdus salina]|uniref:hypothetical protein n=1 Tax=Halorhabdus salina TaxID=2750670 RepID=UPI0015EF6E3D|nr:hypothetical protein [Halorhabdus salina]